MRIWQKWRLDKRLKQYAGDRDIEKILKEDWNDYPEMQIFCKDIENILLEMPQEQYYQKQAEYLALQNQINPHFLYNTLEAIRADAITEGCKSIADTTEALATFFRYTITDVRRFVELSDEIDNVEDYFTIQKFRFGNKLDMNVELESEELLEAQMPKLLLQPLVENAITHGLECKMGEGSVSILIESSDRNLFISVKDNGVGIPAEKVLELNHIFLAQDGMQKNKNRDKGIRGGIALPNVNSRIKLLFGEDYGLRIFSVEGVGTEIRMTLPLRLEME